MRTIKEEGAAGAGTGGMSAGTGGFTGAAAPQGPVAGFDPILKLRGRVKKKIKDQVTPAGPPPVTNRKLIGDLV
jgi:hypothetical protein